MGLMKFKSIRTTPVPPPTVVPSTLPATTAEQVDMILGAKDPKEMSIEERAKTLVDIAHIMIGDTPFIGLQNDELLRFAKATLTKAKAEVAAEQPLDMTTLYNDSTTGIGYKVWSITCTDKELVMRWGRLGAVKNSKRKVFSSARAAMTAMSEVIRQKRAKGYRDHC